MNNSPIGPVVSSSHLADGALAELSELELGLTVASHSFQRWIMRGMAATGLPELSALEVLVLHSVNHRGRAKKLADLCLVLNIEDTHNVAYAIKKLAKAGLVLPGKTGKEKTVGITDKGRKACLSYREIRENLLIQSITELGFDPTQLSRLAALLRSLSGQYDQAARAAASL